PISLITMSGWRFSRRSSATSPSSAACASYPHIPSSSTNASALSAWSSTTKTRHAISDRLLYPIAWPGPIDVCIAGYGLLWERVAAATDRSAEQADGEHDHAQDCKEPADLGGHARHAAEPQECRDDRDHEEGDCHVQHRCVLRCQAEQRVCQSR